MAKITFVTFDGDRHEVEADNGSSVMEAAVKASIPGIDAECGGACACATCHVYVEDTWKDKLEAIDAMEEDMLDFAYDIKANSRLSCQIRMSDALDGLIVEIPKQQA